MQRKLTIYNKNINKSIYYKLKSGKKFENTKFVLQHVCCYCGV